ncbi:HupE/UreJ family protein [Roseibium salinum]|uniref:HupE/UreJ family protein n=1 Tax=Roseibium salinum TaxID=1604349 RepID=A0ABT3R3F9_9HYPH|nr:HupE/UreJ family protein [Roseibium sp. DSM 29163]MCX2723748.1 HupE/UreJ family protein [Roseibium sp. DSM 29163]MDN3718405.1 HupE/UreJ family protein [Roseibium salinum]
MIIRLALAAALSVSAASPALAHVDPSVHGSFAAGFTHPLFGTDHVLAMIAVGLWAALLGGRALWALPTAFVGAMIAGFALSLAGAPLPYVEPLILASVIVFGVAVALALRLPLGFSAALVAAFGVCHGYAHGGEIGSAGEFGYAAGFVLATALLHAAGLLIGHGAHIAARNDPAWATRVIRGLGVVTALGGLYLTAG